jgi:hypothetical protein
VGTRGDIRERCSPVAPRDGPGLQAEGQVQRRRDCLQERLRLLPAASRTLELSGTHTRPQELLAQANEHQFQF